MIEKTAPTFWARIYIAGPLERAKLTCQEFCMTGLCVTIEPTTYIYTGGVEDGVVVELVNYPRFPCEPEYLASKARELGLTLKYALFQQSFMVMTPDQTYWYSERYDR